jgi:hypothetical protein
MRRKWIFAIGMALVLPANAGDVEIAGFDAAQLHLSGSYCTFARKDHQIVLASDWIGKFWIKVDGKIMELASHRTDDEAERQLARRRWDETLSATDLTVKLNLAEVGRGDDTSAYKGYIDVKRRGSSTRISVVGGCGA